MRFYWERVEASPFCQQIWNASRFVMMNLEDFEPQEIDVKQLALKDRWILKRINEVTQEVTDSIEKFEIGLAAQKFMISSGVNSATGISKWQKSTYTVKI